MSEVLTKSYIHKVIERLKLLTNVENDRQLALKLGMFQSSLIGMLKRGGLPYDRIVSLAITDKIDLNSAFLLKEVDQLELSRAIKSKDIVDDSLMSNIGLLKKDKEFLRLPIPKAQESLQIHMDGSTIYVVDTNDINIVNGSVYLISINGVFIPTTISIDFSGNYLLKSENNSDKLSKDEFSSIEIIGKIKCKYTKEVFH
jgi:hypothetical protein